ncbi:MAG: 6-phosphogluconolactonase [Desulfobacterales bacterium S5133MH4]|nr:MAG: 6-phosphogluconolactonase [Desulfobacterales bacterium S5133MH4]
MEKGTPPRWHMLDDPDAVAKQAAQRILQSASRAIAERNLFRIVLAGGHTPEAAYGLLVGADTDWSRWEIYFGDERCLPADHAERNSIMAARTLLDRVAVPAANVHPIPAERGAEAAAAAYEPVVRAAMPFDLVLLGIGEDGHTGSLFPGQQHPAAELVHAVHNAPKPPPDRVSLSVRALCEAREVLVLATGVGKRDAIRAWQAGEPLPIAEIGGPAPVDVLLDKAAQS